MDYISGAYFEILLAGVGPPLFGKFTSVSGLSMEVDYEVYNEGGANYPRFFMKEVKPQTLVLEQGVIMGFDGASILMNMINTGMSIPLAGAITLKDALGETQRVWTIVGAHIQKYIGPDLNSNQPNLAVNRIELIYNGCT